MIGKFADSSDEDLKWSCCEVCLRNLLVDFVVVIAIVSYIPSILLQICESENY